MTKNNGHQNFTYGLGIPTPPPPYLGNIPKKKLSASLQGAQKRTFHGLSDRKRLPAPLPLTVSFS